MSTRARIAVVIPARMGSSRFPGKPLVGILDLPMVEHVRRRCLLVPGLTDVVVATCDDDIRTAVEAFGGRVIMTSPAHERATERVEEAARQLDCDVVVNLQGDEPTVLPELVDRVTRPFLDNDAVLTTCLVYPLTEPADMTNPNVVKTVLSRRGAILYFSRSAIPSMLRNRTVPCFKQSGIMAFSREFLHRYVQLEPTPLEAAESVDMLRVLEHDYRIMGVVTELETRGVDVPDDVPQVERILRTDPVQSRLYRRIVGA